MKTFFHTAVSFIAIATLCACEANQTQIVSPNEALTVTVEPAPEGAYGEAAFSVDYKGERVLSHTLFGIETEARKLAGNLKLKSVSEAKPVTDDYRMLTGKRSHCVNHASERVYTFENEQGQTLDVTFRAYDDGIAFKYGFQTDSVAERVTREHTAYTLPRGAKRWIQKYDIGYEQFYPLSTDGTLPDQPEVDTWGYPALAEPRDSVFVLITEYELDKARTCVVDLLGTQPRDERLPPADGVHRPGRPHELALQPDRLGVGRDGERRPCGRRRALCLRAGRQVPPVVQQQHGMAGPRSVVQAE